MSKPSYLERSINSFFAEKIVGGFKNLVEKPLLPFSITAVSVLGLNIVVMILYSQNFAGITPEVVRRINLAGFLVAASFVGLGPISAVWKKYIFQLSLVFSGIIASIAWIFYANPDPAGTGFQILKALFLFAWVIISSFSLFFLIFFFFTGFAGRVATSGKSKDHIFLDPFVKLATLAMFGYSLWLIIENMTLSAVVIGSTGILAGIAFFVFIRSGERDETKCNVITILGVYSFYILYHLSGSIRPSNNPGDIITELLLLIVIAFYNVQSMATRVKAISTSRLEEEEAGRKFFFQKRFTIFAKIKRAFGEISLMLVSMGFAMGYFLFVLSVYVDPTLPFISGFFYTNVGMSVFSHRLFSLGSLIIFCIIIFFYKKSETFREFATNTYTFQQGLKVLEEKIRKNITLESVASFLFGSGKKKAQEELPEGKSEIRGSV